MRTRASVVAGILVLAALGGAFGAARMLFLQADPVGDVVRFA